MQNDFINGFVCSMNNCNILCTRCFIYIKNKILNLLQAFTDYYNSLFTDEKIKKRPPLFFSILSFLSVFAYFLYIYSVRSSTISKILDLKYNITNSTNTLQYINGTQVNITEERYFLKKDLILKTEFRRPFFQSSTLTIFFQNIIVMKKGEKIFALLAAALKTIVDVSIKISELEIKYRIK